MKQPHLISLLLSGRKSLLWRLRACAGVPLIVLIASIMTGCTLQSAPSFALFGAFFPAWMLIAGIWILAAAGTRAALLATGLSEVLPLQLLVCLSAGLVIAILAWLVGFAP